MLQYFGFITSVLYMILEIRQAKAMWILGIISSAVYAVVFLQVELYAAMSLQIYYLFISISGWYEWRRGKEILRKEVAKRDCEEKDVSLESRLEDEAGINRENNRERESDRDYQRGDQEKKRGASEGIFIRRVSVWTALISLLVGAALYLLLSRILSAYTGDPNPQVDSLIASISAVATYWLSKSYIEQWYLWMIANSVSVILYFSESMYPTAILYILYLGTAFLGFYHWKKKGILLK